MVKTRGEFCLSIVRLVDQDRVIIFGPRVYWVVRPSYRDRSRSLVVVDGAPCPLSTLAGVASSAPLKVQGDAKVNLISPRLKMLDTGDWL